VNMQRTSKLVSFCCHISGDRVSEWQDLHAEMASIIKRIGLYWIRLVSCQPSCRIGIPTVKSQPARDESAICDAQLTKQISSQYSPMMLFSAWYVCRAEEHFLHPRHDLYRASSLWVHPEHFFYLFRYPSCPSSHFDVDRYLAEQHRLNQPTHPAQLAQQRLAAEAGRSSLVAVLWHATIA